MKTASAVSQLGASQTSLTAVAGEYYILARLCLLGKIAAQAPRGVPNADIVVSSVIGDRLCAIQVKTIRVKGGDGGWHMSRKHEEIRVPQLFYAFVDFCDPLSPKTFILPSETVAVAIRSMHVAWLAAPGRHGQQRNDTDFRRFLPDYTVSCGESAAPYIGGWLDKYHEAWDLLP